MITFISNISGADLAYMLLISKLNKGIRFLFCVIDIYGKYAWVIPLKDIKDYNYDYKCFSKNFKWIKTQTK